MKTKRAGLVLAFYILQSALCFAADPEIGTWKLNESKSKFTPGTFRNTTVVYKSMPGTVKITTNGIRPDGTPAHGE